MRVSGDEVHFNGRYEAIYREKKIMRIIADSILDRIISGMEVKKINGLIPMGVELTEKEFRTLTIEIRNVSLYDCEMPVTEMEILGLPIYIVPSVGIS